MTSSRSPDSLIAQAAARVVRWIAVPESWAGHRCEPLAVERLWACTAEGVGPRRAGFDAEGRVVLVEPAERRRAGSGVLDWVDVVRYAPDGRSVVLHVFGRGGERRATTSLDRDGRPVSTAYVAAADERYEYTSDGRLVVIDESPGMLELVPPPWRVTPHSWFGVPGTDRLNVEWDGDGERPSVIRRAGDHQAIWERLAEPWPEALRGFARALADRAIASMAQQAPSIETTARDEVFGMALVADDVSWPSTRMTLWAGRQATRERLLADRAADPFSVEEYLWLLQDPYGPSLVAGVELSEELDRAALRATAMHHPGDPRRMLAQATAPLVGQARLELDLHTDSGLRRVRRRIRRQLARSLRLHGRRQPTGTPRRPS